MMTNEIKGREFEIAAQVTELLDNLPEDEQQQIMALLNRRYGVPFKQPSAPRRGYRPSPNRRT